MFNRILGENLPNETKSVVRFEEKMTPEDLSDQDAKRRRAEM